MNTLIKMFEGTGEQAMLSVLAQVEEFTKNVGRDFEVTNLSTAMNGEGASRRILIAFTARFPPMT